jgi:spore coat polysaccharide biosynthesis protein SpsF
MILAVLQARLSSTRLPGKVLKPVLGEPMILRQIERLSRSSMIDELVVATSTESSDDPLALLLADRGIQVRRGPLADVAARFDAVVREFAPSTLVRLTADCPLADWDVIDGTIRSHLAAGADYTSNTLTLSFPNGLDAECVSAAAWAEMTRMPLTPAEREHVTIGIYTRPERFTLNAFSQEVDRSDLRWTVDLPGDLEFVRSLYAHLYPINPAFGQEAIAAFLGEHPELNRTEADGERESAQGN